MKKLAITIICVLACLLSLSGGFFVGAKRALDSTQVRDSYLGAINAAAAYSAHAEIVEALNAQKSSRALCLLSLQASAEVNQVRACLAELGCRRLVEDKLQEIAPELLVDGSLRVTYYRQGELCKP